MVKNTCAWPAKFAIMVNMKCRNDQIRSKRAENKVKPSNIVYNLVNAREAREHFSF